jgi:hypothetical protein
VKKYLQKNLPELEWQPGKEYVSKHILKDPPKRRRSKEKAAEETDLQCWEWALEIAPGDWNDILWKDREARIQQRMGLLGKILAGLVALLAVVAGYIRLDDWTKGYYTGWLRLAAGGILAVVVTGLFWLP